jgi:hypothetical protein
MMTDICPNVCGRNLDSAMRVGTYLTADNTLYQK